VSTERRVVVTGLGMITSLGRGVKRNWTGMLDGESGVRKIQRFDTTGMDVRIASEVYPLPHVPQDDDTDQFGLHARFAYIAGVDAWADSGLAESGAADPERVGVFLGSGKGVADLPLLTPALKAGYQPGNFDYGVYMKTLAETYPLERRELECYYQSGTHLATAVDARGPNWICITACAAGNHALGEAFEAIVRGDADVILAGGAHSQIDHMSLAGYGTLGALSDRNDEPHRASRPFDRKRNGFVLGEGGGVLILEELEHAKARGADIRAELVGYGNTADAHRATDPHPEGMCAERAMRQALSRARLDRSEIGYINAHGTSTALNDAMETAAMKRLFGQKGEAPPVSSVKSMLGHLIAAAGAVEAIACVRALQEGVVPPTINYENEDPVCDLDYVPNTARELKGLRYAMNNSFGFGGQNITTIFKKF